MLRKSVFPGPLLVCLPLALCLLAACAKSAPTRFYSLAGECQEQAIPPGPCRSLGIGPVDMPAYLDRTQIVTRGEGSRMNLSDFDQWIEPVQANFTRALMDALAGKVCAKPIVAFPWSGNIRPDFQVAVQVREFGGTLGKEAVLRADWSLIDQEGRVLAWKSSLLREPSAGSDHAALVTAQKRLVDRLALEMAGALSGQAR